MGLKGWLLLLVLVVAGAGLAWLVQERVQESAQSNQRPEREKRPVPVEVAAIEQGSIELRRYFTGTLETHAELLVAPKVSGRVEELNVDLADPVKRGQVVARLDNAEYVQAVKQAQANLAVANANEAEAQSQLKLAERELARIDKLRASGVTSESQRDVAKADQLAKQAHVEVTRAQVERAQAELELARIRLGYTEVTADWRGGDDQRTVAERLVDEGETVSANTPLLRIVELNPITAVFYVTERDYGLLRTGQSASLRTDAYPDQTFAGQIKRIAPVFRESARQARVEMQVHNQELLLKPGMFVRAAVTLRRADDAVIVPDHALAKREGADGVFLVVDGGKAVSWRPVQVGIRDGDRVQVQGEGLQGRVVVLGQQLLKDGSAILLPQDRQSKDAQKRNTPRPSKEAQRP